MTLELGQIPNRPQEDHSLRLGRLVTIATGLRHNLDISNQGMGQSIKHKSSLRTDSLRTDSLRTDSPPMRNRLQQ